MFPIPSSTYITWETVSIISKEGKDWNPYSEENLDFHIPFQTLPDNPGHNQLLVRVSVYNEYWPVAVGGEGK